MRDYQLHSIDEGRFEELVRHLCREILGLGTVAYSKGPDGGRDGRFEGTSTRYPSSSAPWKGKFIIQAKHTTNPIARCSDGEFWKNKTSVVAREKPKMRQLREAGEVDNYLLFTNRRLGGETESALLKELRDETGIPQVAILGIETITELLARYPAVVRHIGGELFGGPIRFHSEDIKQVILAFRGKGKPRAFRVPDNYEYVEIDRKNKINNLRREDFDFVVENSEPYFAQIRDFLGDPVNEEVAVIYEDFAMETNHKVHLRRDDFTHFSEVFEHLYDQVTLNEPELRPRNLIWVFLHFMYVHCDLGRK